MVYVVGDIHGEVSKLKQLITYVEEADAQCSFVFIGDYIDKGENAAATLEYLGYLANKYICCFLLGNHEYLWNNVTVANSEYLIKYGGGHTIKSFGVNSVLETVKILSSTYHSFFKNLVPFFIHNGYIVTHSGIPPAFYQTQISSIPIYDLLFNRFDFIKQSCLYLDRYKVVFGHTAFYKPYYDGYKIGIDTGACFLEKQPLTAFNLDSHSFINSDNQKYPLSDGDLLFCPNIIRNKPWRTSND